MRRASPHTANAGRRQLLAVLAGLSMIAACAAPRRAEPPKTDRALPAGLDPARDGEAFASTYRAPYTPPLAIVNATILTAAGPRIDGGTILIEGGRIAAVGTSVPVPAGTRLVDAQGRYVTPGLVDPHSHIGGSSSPPTPQGVNERRDPAGVRVEHAIWPQDPMFDRARAAGVTAMQILPGSSSIINGSTVTLKNVRSVSVEGMKFPGAVAGLKLACGENPAGGQDGGSNTRAGVMRDFRATLIRAADYADTWKRWRLAGTGEAPKRDLSLDGVAELLGGTARAQVHCYRAEEMVQMIGLAHEFGFRITAFHHANEAFKIVPDLIRERIAVVTWAGDWAGYKMEAYDSIMETPAAVDRAGGTVAMHSDDVEYMQHLNQEAARSMAAGRRAGLAVGPDEAIRWVTINPARIIGIDAQTGSLEPGKMADVVVWDADPFSVYSLPDLVFVDGVLVHDRAAAASPRSDFELGNAARREPPAHPVPSWDAER